MSFVSADTSLAATVPSVGVSSLAPPVPYRSLVTVAAFGLYWLSALLLQARGATLVFGADAHLYSMLLDGTPIDRVTRFHPLTTGLIVVWVKLVGPLTLWLPAKVLYKVLFAAIGAAGVWGAIAAFAAIGLRRHAALWGIVYATSLGVWYFSSIEESKIVTTTLVAFYIATYLRLRVTWSTRGAVLLTGLLLLACLNEIIAAFLVAIPAVDALVQHGWNVRVQLRRSWWIACHALAAPVAFLFLEFVVNGWLVPAGDEPEGASHVSMLLFYLLQNDFSAATIYAFVVRWLFFNMAAPTVDATFGAAEGYYGDFEPVLSSYLQSPVSVGLAVLVGAILAVSLLPRHRGQMTRDMAGIMLGVLAYALLRGLFFLIVNPGECILFASAVTLPHMLLIAVPFAVSAYPRRQALLAGAAALLFVANGSFILGP